MNKARKKTYKDGFAKRLVNESLVLSLTRKLSLRFTRLFEYGILSPLVKSYKMVDSFVGERITGPIFKKIGMRENFSMPARNAVATFFAENPVMKALARLRSSFLNTSVRSVGIFMFTFGIYAAALFMLKSYVTLSFGAQAGINDISVSAVTLLVGLLFMIFGEKTLISSLGGSKIIGSLLSNCLGINDSSFERHKNASPKTDVAVAFLLGSACGIATLFFPPSRVLLFILTVIGAIAIINIPEFGLLLSVAVFSFLPIGISLLICAITLFSYLFKCIRLKRNFRFGTADTVVLLMFFAMLVSCLISDDGIIGGEYYLLCVTSLYFVAKNLLCSEKLVVQAFETLCTGLNIGMALYILGDFATLIPHADVRNAAMLLTSHTLAPEMLALLVSVMLPFALSSFSSVGGRRPREGFLLLAAVCTAITDSALFYILVLVSFFIYIAFAYKAPAGALLGAAAVLPPVAVYSFEHTVSYAVRLGTRLSYDSSLALSENTENMSFWGAMPHVGGALAALLFIGSFLLILQRLLGVGIGESGTKRSLYIGTAVSSAVMLAVCSFMFNSFADLRIYAAMCFILGLCGGLYNTISVIKRSEEV